MIRYYGNVVNKNFAQRFLVVWSNGVVVQWPKMPAGSVSLQREEFICDTPEEAEKMRLLIEQRREEREALDRKWELRLAEEVSR